MSLMRNYDPFFGFAKLNYCGQASESGGRPAAPTRFQQIKMEVDNEMEEAVELVEQKPSLSMLQNMAKVVQARAQVPIQPKLETGTGIKQEMLDIKIKQEVLDIKIKQEVLDPSYGEVDYYEKNLQLQMNTSKSKAGPSLMRGVGQNGIKTSIKKGSGITKTRPPHPEACPNCGQHPVNRRCQKTFRGFYVSYKAKGKGTKYVGVGVAEDNKLVLPCPFGSHF